MNELTYKSRMTALQDKLRERGIDLAILNLNSDLFYYSGSVQALVLLVSAQGGGVLVARKALERLRNEADCLPLETFQNTKDLLNIVLKYGLQDCKTIGFTVENTSYATVNRWLQLIEGARAVDISWDIRYLRMVKDEGELAIFREGGAILAEIPKLVRENFRPGMTELELSAVIENFMRLNGHGGLTRCRREGIEMNYGVCASGMTALAGTKFDGICGGEGLDPAIPYGASRKVIVPGEPVIMDFGFLYRGYHLDQTRMFCWGEPSEQIKRAFEAMQTVERHIFGSLKPGVIWSELYESSVALAEDLGFGEEFMGVEPEKVRFVGHGVGLELDEPPYLAPKMNYPIAAGMVLALEPKVAIPGIGVIGNEDTVIITETGVELVTLAAPELVIV